MYAAAAAIGAATLFTAGPMYLVDQFHPEPEVSLPSVYEATILRMKQDRSKAPISKPPNVIASTTQATVSGTTLNSTVSNPPTLVNTSPKHVHKLSKAPASMPKVNPVVTHEVDSLSDVTTGPSQSSPGWSLDVLKDNSKAVLHHSVFQGVLAVTAAALTATAIYKMVELYNRHRLNQCIAVMERSDNGKVHLFIHQRSPLSPSVSIPCTQVETFLRVAKIPYQAHVISDTSVSPDGHLPFIVYNGQRLADSQVIMQHLGTAFHVNLDEDLRSDQRATGVALLSALEYSLRRGYTRSVLVDRPDVIRPYYSEMNHVPDFVTRFSLRRLSQQLMRANEDSGYALLSQEQYQHELIKDVQAIEALLAHHHFLFSDDHPTTYDCALYAMLLPIVAMDGAAEVNEAFEYVVTSDVITTYVKQITKLAFPDFDDLIKVADPSSELKGSVGVSSQE